MTQAEATALARAKWGDRAYLDSLRETDDPASPVTCYVGLGLPSPELKGAGPTWAAACKAAGLL